MTMIYEGDIRANSNDDLLDCFAYDKIEGSLIVESSSVTTIDLPDLVEITGDLVIVFNDFLTDIRGLGALKKVGGNVRLENNDGLSVDQIETLCQRLEGGGVGGNLTSDVRKGQSSQATFEGDAKIQSNADVLLYSGFATIKGRLSIEGLQVNALKLDNLVQVKGDVVIHGTAMRSLHGLANLQLIGGELTIMDNPSISNVELESLESIGKDFTVRDNIDLEFLSGLKTLKKVGGNLEIAFNQVLSSKETEELVGRISEHDGVKGDITISDNSPL